MKPILKYPGAKWKLADWSIDNLPPHESYLEPYFGSGAVFFNKEPSRIETINDIDGTVVNFFRVCRDAPDELARVLNLTPWAREEFEMADMHDLEIADVERARRFAVRCWMAFGSSASSTAWRHTTGNKKDGDPENPKLWNQTPKIVREVAERLKIAQIENRPALDTIAAHNGPEVLIYADPPYVHSTRTAHRMQYRHEMSDNNHRELLNAMKAHTGMALISGYENALYDEALKDWQKIQKDTVAERGAKRTERLWINPEAIKALEGTYALFQRATYSVVNDS